MLTEYRRIMALQPERAAEWFARVSEQLAETGHRESDWSHWDSWPFTADGRVKPLRAPEVEQERRGAGGIDCRSCESGRTLPLEVIWHDEAFFLVPAHESALSFAAFLMPRAHARLSG